MIDTDKYEGQIEFDDVLREIEVGVDISEGNYDILRYYRDEYKDLLAEVKRLREQLIQAESWVWVEGGHIFETSEDRLKHYKEYIGDD